MRIPQKIKLHKASRQLELVYEGEHFLLSAELLRTHSPSAEVQGHGKPVLQYGKLNVGIEKLETSGNYALKITFDDGHDSGLFTWAYLEELARNQDSIWNEYVEALAAAGKSRDPDVSAVKLML